MPNFEPSERVLVSGLLVSLAAHMALWGVASGFVRIPERSQVQSGVTETQRLEPTKPVVKLGIDDGKVDATAWLGFRESTPHEGLKSEVEQSAMTLRPGKPAEVPSLSAAARQVPAVTSSAVRESAQSLADIAGSLSTQRPEATTKEQVESQKAGSGGAGGGLGLGSDKESVAAAVKNAVRVRLGQVAAADGLDIQTRSPRWSVTTLVARRPANPTLQITFGRDGRVVRAAFVTDGERVYSTGAADVDEPLLSAVYSWVARGKRLEELTAQDPRGEVTIVMTVIFSG